MLVGAGIGVATLEGSPRTLGSYLRGSGPAVTVTPAISQCLLDIPGLPD